ncbi:MAG: ATP-binding protein [Pseudorhodoferax sp.]
MTIHGIEPPPWLSWFNGLDTDDGLRARVTHLAEAPQGLERDAPVVACGRMLDAWKATYIPCTAHLATIRQLVDRVRLNAMSRIKSVGDFEAAVYAQSPVVHFDQEIWGVTGLAGCGKSSATKAFVRALSSGEKGSIAQSVLVPIEPVVRIEMQAQRSTKPVLESLANPVFVAGRKKIAPDEMLQHLRKWLYSKGTQVLLVDEMQAMTRGTQSTALIANLLGDLNSLGPAVVYVFNYSLGHKLMTRPQEDKDRLLSNCLTLDPPSADDRHWHAVVKEYVRLGSGLIRIDSARDALTLHRLTGGLYRLLRILLREACRSAWPLKVGRAVTMDDVRAAYQSTAYASQRGDVEALRSLHFSGLLTRKRRDLVVPLPGSTPSTAPDKFVEVKPLVDQPPPAAAVHLMESALNADERRVLAKLRAPLDEPAIARPSAKVTRLPRRSAIDAESLLAGARLLSDGKLQEKAQKVGAEHEAG